MNTADWMHDAEQARADRRAETAALENPPCARCDRPAWVSSPELGVDLCLVCHDEFKAWDRANPTAPYDEFLPDGFVDPEPAPVDDIPPGHVRVGPAPLLIVAAVVAFTLWVGITAPYGTALQLIAAPVAIVVGASVAAVLLQRGESR